MSTPTDRGKPSGFPTKLFVAILLAYALFTSGTVRSYDGAVMLAVTRSMVLRGSFEVPDLPGCKVGVDGKRYGRYGIGTSLAALPWFLAGQLAANLVSDELVSDDIVTEFAVSWLNPVITALGCMVLYLLAVEVGLAAPVAAGCALIYAFGTGAFVQMKDFNSEPLAGLLLLAAVYHLLVLRKHPSWRRAAVAGACVGGLLLVRIACVVAIPVLLLGLIWIALDSGKRSRLMRWLVAFAVPIVAAVALIGGYNYVRFGSPAEFGYPPSTFTFQLWRGLGMNLFSPEAGILLYAPIVILFPLGAVLLWRTGPRATTLFALLFVAFLVLYAVSASPTGGHSAGSRFLLVVMPYLVIFVGAIGQRYQTRRWRVILVTLVTISVLVQLPLVYTNVSYYYARRTLTTDTIGQRFAKSLLVQSWQIAAEVTHKALYRGQWLRSLAPRTTRGADAATLVAESRPFHLPYLWWVLAYYYGAPIWPVAAMMAALIIANCLAWMVLRRSWPDNRSGQPGRALT